MSYPVTASPDNHPPPPPTAVMPKRASTKSRRSRAETSTTMDVSRSIIPRSPRVHTFERMIYANTIPKAGLADSGFGVSFALSDLPNYTEFTSLFDQYRIDWVDYIFELGVPIEKLTLMPYIYFSEDHDDNSTPTITDIVQRQNCETLVFGSNRTQIKRRIVPNVVNAVYNTAVTSGYTRAKPGAWVDCAYPSVPHYGVKYFIQSYNGTTNSTAVINVALRYQVSFKELF